MNQKKQIKSDVYPDKIPPAVKYGISLDNLTLLAWANMILVPLEGFFSQGQVSIFPIAITLNFLLITLSSFILSFFNKFIENYQILAYVLIFFNALMTALVFVDRSFKKFIGNDPENLSPARVRIYLISVTVLFIVSVICFVIFHQQKLVLKLNKGKALSFPFSFGLIVIVTLLDLNTSLPLLDTILGLSGVLIGTELLPGMAVGALFCIIDLIKHPELKNNYE